MQDLLEAIATNTLLAALQLTSRANKPNAYDDTCEKTNFRTET